jgi:hypothetical protein
MVLNEDFFKSVKTGTVVLAKFSSQNNIEGTEPLYSTPLEVCLYVQRKENGDFLFLTPDVKTCWAEYSRDDYCAEWNEFCNENYRMMILEILEI